MVTDAGITGTADQLLGEHIYAHDRIADFMGDTRRQLADGCQPFTVEQLLFQQSGFRLIFKQNNLAFAAGLLRGFVQTEIMRCSRYVHHMSVQVLLGMLEKIPKNRVPRSLDGGQRAANRLVGSDACQLGHRLVPEHYLLAGAVVINGASGHRQGVQRVLVITPEAVQLARHRGQSGAIDGQSGRQVMNVFGRFIVQLRDGTNHLSSHIGTDQSGQITLNTIAQTS